MAIITVWCVPTYGGELEAHAVDEAKALKKEDRFGTTVTLALVQMRHNTKRTWQRAFTNEAEACDYQSRGAESELRSASLAIERANRAVERVNRWRVRLGLPLLDGMKVVLK